MAASSTIYGFITDTLFWNKKTVDLNKSIDKGLGYLDDILINYFHQIATVNDPRDERLDVIGTIPSGTISVLFDASKMDPDTGPFVNISDEDVTHFFNILEKCYFTQNRTELELNNELITGEVFVNYVNDSVRRSSKYTLTTVTGIRSELKIYDYIEFDMVIASEQIHFKLWINSENFKANYPLTTITKVIPPCEPRYLLDPALQTNATTAIIASSESIFSNFNEGTTDVDHTGTLAYRTKWIISSQNVPEVKFGLMYQGAVPSSLEARAAIREYLIGLGIAQESLWEAKFPDLFVTAQFFIIPHWGNTTDRPDNKYGSVYPAIINHTKLYEETYRILPSFDPTWIQNRLEVLTNPFNPIIMTAVPDPLNENDRFALRDILTTYQAFGPDDTNYDYQEANAKNFSRYLGQAMSILYGDEVPANTGLTENTFYDRRYLSFSTDQVEYHILYREDYTTTAEE